MLFRPILLRTRLPSRPFSSRAFLRQEQPQYQAPAAPSKPNPHRQVYKQGGVGRAVAFNFLVAMVTFQALYWSWLKLESIEVKQDKQAELDSLEGTLKTWTGFKEKETKSS